MPGRADRADKGAGGGGIAAGGGEFVELVVAYAKQETLGPLRGLGRFLALGVVATISWSLGSLLLLVALLRSLQTETGSTFQGDLSWLPYLITLVVALAVAGLALWRITKTPSSRTAADDGGGEGR